MNRSEDFANDVWHHGHQYDLDQELESIPKPVVVAAEKPVFTFNSDTATQRPIAKIPVTPRKFAPVPEGPPMVVPPSQAILSPEPSSKAASTKRAGAVGEHPTRTISTPPGLIDLELLQDNEALGPTSFVPPTAWVEKLWRQSRAFELGTFQPSIIAAMMQVQAEKWRPLAAGYVSDIICGNPHLRHYHPGGSYAGITGPWRGVGPVDGVSERIVLRSFEAYEFPVGN